MKRAALFGCLLVLLGALSAFAAGDKLTISYVKAPFNLQLIVMKEQGFLEKELAPLGVTSVRWPEMESGAQQARALASGDLDIAGAMSSISILIANSENNPVKIIAGIARPTDVFTLVAKRSDINSIKDLKGKTVAGPKGTVLHQLLAGGLEKEGMKASDVNFLQMGISKAFVALQTGHVDAALLAAGTAIKATQQGARILATATGLVEPKLAIAASEAFIQKHPARVKAVIAAHDKAWQWIVDNPEKAIALGAKEEGLSIEDAGRLFTWSHFTQRFNAADIPDMEADMHFMLKNGMMRRTVDVPSILLPQAIE